jgi:broad specificity phosphatase PhoE
MKVILIRHGQSEGNIIPVIQGQMDYPLTKKGVEQAHNAGKELKKTYHFDKIYSSDLLRASQTAEIIASYFDITDAILSENLRELHFGIYQDRKSLELTKEESAHLSSCWNNITQRYPGGETVKELSTRVKDAFTEIANSNNEDSAILIVSHRRALFCIIKEIIGNVPIVTAEWFKNCSVNELARDNSSGKWRLIRFDNDYLNQPSS